MRVTRITLCVIALVILAGFNLLVKKQLADVEPQLFQATEEAMVDTANILADFAGQDFSADQFDPKRFEAAMKAASDRKINADIFKHSKLMVGMQVYITDRNGIIIFDSGYPERVGADFSQFRDVYRTLRGKYGARSTRLVESDDTSSVLHVAAPIGDPKNPAGVLTVYKKQSDAMPIIRRRISEIWWGTGLIGGGILFCVGVIFIWQYLPVSRLTEYARDIEQGKRRALPKIGMGKEVNTLAKALESMRESLEGRRYAERYVQTLTHEMKSPLAGIRGAAELLNEDRGSMPEEDKRRFLNNIAAETLRADRLLAKLLELSALEGKSQLDAKEVIDLTILVTRVIDDLNAMAELGGVKIHFNHPVSQMMVAGDAFILKAAIANLLENAIDFSPDGSEVQVKMQSDSGFHRVIIEDRGEGIPEYAKEKVFDRFFSLRHLRTGRKGTGLGLTLVREAAELHMGSVALESAEPTGTRAIFSVPGC